MLSATAKHGDFELYEQRNPKAGQYYQCVQAHFEELEMVWDDRFQRHYGFWRPYVNRVIYRYLDCGDLHLGFARVRCPDCGHEYLLPFSCKRRHFCPSCHQKRVVEFGEWLCSEVLKHVPHRQWVVSIPKRLRTYFLYDRSLLAELSRCAWKVLSAYLKSVAPCDAATPGAVVAVHTFGDFQQFNPHLHIIATDGSFTANDAFAVAGRTVATDLEDVFRHEVFNLLEAAGKINAAVIENMLGWHHSGFNVYCGPAIWPGNDKGLEDLARYIVRACFSQERMTYIEANRAMGGGAKVVYESRDGRTSKTFDALDWLAQLVTHIPNRYEQTVRYYGYYSNKSSDLRKKAGVDDQVPALISSTLSSRACRRNWARLIQKVYQTDPLLCPKCQGAMKIVAFIEDEPIVRKILEHLGLWDTRNHDPPQPEAMHILPTPDSEFTYDYTYSQLPPVDYHLQ